MKDGKSQQLSQSPYEDRLDTLLLAKTPISHSSKSMSSEFSQCSSGYCSDNSYGGSVGSKSSQLCFPEDNCKSLPSIAEKEQEAHETFTTPLSQIASDKLIHSGINSLENESIQRVSISSTKDLQSNFLLSPKSSKQDTLSTKVSKIPKPSSIRFMHISESCHSLSDICKSSAAAMVTIQDKELAIHKW